MKLPIYARARIGVAATALVMILGASPAFAANGGSGGYGRHADGGAGGSSNNTGVAGDDGTGPGTGGGGGVAGAYGGDGASANQGGGGGGGGGGLVGLSTGGGTIASQSATDGGNGGSGGEGLINDGGGGGGGGAGGIAVRASGIAPNVAITGTVTGGNGGAGGNGGSTGGGFAGDGGDGGDGGEGITFSMGGSLINSGVIEGGAGGAGGDGGTDTNGNGNNGAAGAGGVGVLGVSDVTTSGTIRGGLSGDGLTRANAIELGGSGSVELQDGYAFEGNVVGGGNARLYLGGTDDSTFDVSGIGTQYIGFDTFRMFGSGQWEITGTTSETTNWSLEGGTFVVSDDGALGDSTGTLTLKGGTLQWGASFDLDAARTLILDGSGVLDVQDYETVVGQAITDATVGSSLDLRSTALGHITLNGVNTYLGTTGVGTDTHVTLGDESHSSARIAGGVLLDAGAVFDGFGSIGGALGNYSATVMPGSASAIGTLSVGGDYLQSSGNLIIHMTPTGSSKLAVTGDAYLGSALTLVYAPGVYATHDYEILTASSVNGTFSTITGSAPLGPLQAIDQEIEYNADNVTVALTSFALAPTGIDMVLSQSTASLMSGQGANDVLLGAAGSAGAGGSGASASSDGYVRLALADDAALAGVMPAPSSQTSVWMKAIGRDTDIDASNGAAGFDAQSGGFMLGADRALGGGVVAGVAAGYGYTGIDDDTGSEGTVENARVALYGSVGFGDVTVNATLGYAHDFFDADRAVAGLVASSNHDGDEINAGLAAHTNIVLGDVTLTPKAGMRYVALFEDGYTETGAPGFNLVVDDNDSDSLQPFVGAEISKAFKNGGSVITPSASIEYARELMDDAPASTVSVGGGTFAIAGVEPSRDRLTLGAGLDVAVDKSLSVQVGYRATLPTGNVFEQVADVGVVWRF